MTSQKTKTLPWWFTLSKWDVIPSQKVTQQFTPTVLQKLNHAFINAQYPNRPKKVNEWTETYIIDGAKYMISCHINEVNKKVIWKKITTSNKSKKRHK
jgi:hypothetical protein